MCSEKKTMSKALLSNIVIMLAGPALTIYWYMSSNGNITTSAVLYMLLFAVVLVFITTIVAFIVHNKAKTSFAKKVLISIIVSECCYLIITSLIILIFEKHDPESRIWLPVILLILVPYTLPAAISVSYGFGKIVELLKKSIKQKKKE